MRASRAEPLAKQTIVGEVNPRLSMSLDQTRTLINRTVISSGNDGYDEARRVRVELSNSNKEGQISRAKVVIHGSRTSPSPDSKPKNDDLRVVTSYPLLNTENKQSN
jgi:hypothetical protein